MAGRNELTVVDQVKSVILPLRGHKVILDRDLAALYEVDTRILNRAVQRNLDRFPDDFMFQLDLSETTSLATTYERLKNLKFARRPPYVFTEHGALMAASVLNSAPAVEASIFVVRAFVKLRELLFTHKELGKKFTELESRLANHDVAIQQLLHAIRQLMDEPPSPSKPKIGFRP